VDHCDNKSIKKHGNKWCICSIFYPPFFFLSIMAIQVPANFVGTANPGNTGVPTAGAFNVASGASVPTYLKFRLVMGANAFTAPGFILAAGPKFTKTSYALPAAATLTLSDTSSANTSLYNPNENTATAYATILQFMSELPTVIEQIKMTASSQDDISGNAFVAYYRNVGNVSMNNVARYDLDEYFIPGNYNTTSSGTVIVNTPGMMLNDNSFLVLENGISINESATFTIRYRAAGGGSSFVQSVGA
jgi:hypothetical protein